MVASARAIQRLSESERCPMCRAEFPGGLMVRPQEAGANPCFDGRFMFHMQSTHGLFPEDVVSMVSSL